MLCRLKLIIPEINMTLESCLSVVRSKVQITLQKVYVRMNIQCICDMHKKELIPLLLLHVSLVFSNQCDERIIFLSQDLRQDAHILFSNTKIIIHFLRTYYVYFWSKF